MHPIIKKYVKLSLFADDMILYIQNPKAPTNRFLLINLPSFLFFSTMSYNVQCT